MKVSYSRFFDKLKANGYTQKVFKEESGISGGTMGKLIKNQNINVDTICKICDFFQCMPDEIMECIPDADYEEKRKQKENVEAQIAELQAKLKSI